MARFLPQSQPKKLILFLNISFVFLLLFHLGASNFLNHSNEPLSFTTHILALQDPLTSDGCNGLHEFTDYKSKCKYIKSHIDCRSKGYIDYLQIFYCTCGKFPILGHTVLLLWLLVLFYLLGDTAANYFCSSLDSLSKILKLSPTIAGVTLLSLGNGAPDVFASIVSFTRSSNGDVGLNSILGGAFFVSCAVVGVISIFTNPLDVAVDKSSFIRDVLFFLFTLSFLLLIIFIGKTTVWGAICFLSTYFIYVCVVCVMHFHYGKDNKLNPVKGSPASKSFSLDFQEDFLEIGNPLLGCHDDVKDIQVVKATPLEDQQPVILPLNPDSCYSYYLSGLWNVLEFPLYLPRRLTIPVVSEERWSKLFAVTSAALAPLLLAELCNSQREKKLGSRSSLVTYMVAGLIGMVFGNLAIVTTKKSGPPKKCLFPWLAGGFLMSVTWTYFIAEELVSLLVTLGYVLGISPSVLGLTVLAWGNSLGDLIANVAMAMHGGTDGVQIALSGCYAGPMFNTLLGLGISLLLSSWSNYPAPYLIPEDTSLYETLGFLMGGLLWALVILPKKNMKLDRLLGVGLLAIYCCFLSLRLSRILGLLKLRDVGISLQRIRGWLTFYVH